MVDYLAIGNAEEWEDVSLVSKLRMVPVVRSQILTTFINSGLCVTLSLGMIVAIVAGKLDLCFDYE